MKQFMKMHSLIIILFVLMGFNIFLEGEADSTQENADIAAKNYANDPIQRWVATQLGDEIPKMRDDLIERKDAGEGFVERHWNAWTNLDNWDVDPSNDEKEAAYPQNSED